MLRQLISGTRWRGTIETSLSVSFGICLIRYKDGIIGCHGQVPFRRCYNVFVHLRGNATLFVILWQSTTETTLNGVSFESILKHRGNVSMVSRCIVFLKRRHDVPSWHCEDVTLRRRQVIHLKRNCNIVDTKRKISPRCSQDGFVGRFCFI